MTSSPWRLEGSQAHLAWNGLEAHLDLAHPESGIQTDRLGGAPIPSHALLGVSFSRSTENASDCDVYCRQLDLIATYAELPERPLRVQAYWRAIAAPVDADVETCAVELQVSVQTPLLDFPPQVATQSVLRTAAELKMLPCAAATWSDPTSAASPLSPGGMALAIELSAGDRPWQYVEMIHAEDAQSASAEQCDGVWRIQQELFEPGLEKGVIRRVRVRGLFYAGTLDQALVERAYRTFHGASLPLTV